MVPSCSAAKMATFNMRQLLHAWVQLGRWPLRLRVRRPAAAKAGPLGLLGAARGLLEVTLHLGVRRAMRMAVEPGAEQ